MAGSPKRALDTDDDASAKRVFVLDAIESVLLILRQEEVGIISTIKVDRELAIELDLAVDWDDLMASIANHPTECSVQWSPSDSRRALVSRLSCATEQIPELEDRKKALKRVIKTYNADVADQAKDATDDDGIAVWHPTDWGRKDVGVLPKGPPIGAIIDVWMFR